MDLSQIGKTPIAGDSPGGEDVRYDPEFDELQQEIDKLSSPSADSPADWKNVERIAARILAQRSKDLLVAAYLAIALQHNRREKGLILGTTIFRDLLVNHWDNLFPPKKRAKGRLSIIEWWHDKTNDLIERLAPLSFDSDVMQELLATLDEIDAFLEEHLNDAPAMGVIKRNLERFAEVKAAPGSATAGKPEETATDKSSPKRPQTPTQSAETAEITSPEEARKIVSASLTGIRKAATFFRETEPANPLAYKLWRAAIGLLITDLPPADDNGTTRIPPPPSQVVQALNDAASSGNWEALLKSAESQIAQYPFWLDLDYYSHRALTGLGGNYSRAAGLIVTELVYKLDWLPGLEQLSFADGRPFASPETMGWISRTRKPALPATGPDTLKQEGPSKAGEEEDSICQEAEALARAGELAGAVKLLQDNLATCGTGKARFRLQSDLVNILVQAGKEKLATALADKTLEMIEQFQLETWDPELAFQGLKTVWQCYSASRETEKKRKANEIMLRMSAIDLVKVMSFIKI